MTLANCKLCPMLDVKKRRCAERGQQIERLKECGRKSLERQLKEMKKNV